MSLNSAFHEMYKQKQLQYIQIGKQCAGKISFSGAIILYDVSFCKQPVKLSFHIDMMYLTQEPFPKLCAFHVYKMKGILLSIRQYTASYNRILCPEITLLSFHHFYLAGRFLSSRFLLNLMI